MKTPVSGPGAVVLKARRPRKLAARINAACLTQATPKLWSRQQQIAMARMPGRQDSPGLNPAAQVVGCGL